MKAAKLLTIAPLAATLLTSQVLAQGNPHLDTVEVKPALTQVQGNPHIGFEAPVRYVAQYRGNPHEGESFTVTRVSRTPGNPHIGFEIAPLRFASAQ